MLTDKPNIIITGGCGFIGSHLTKRLLENGFAVTVVDDNRTGNIFYEHEAVEYWKVDVKDFNPLDHLEPRIAKRNDTFSFIVC